MGVRACAAKDQKIQRDLQTFRQADTLIRVFTDEGNHQVVLTGQRLERRIRHLIGHAAITLTAPFLCQTIEVALRNHIFWETLTRAFTAEFILHFFADAAVLRPRITGGITGTGILTC